VDILLWKYFYSVIQNETISVSGTMTWWSSCWKCKLSKWAEFHYEKVYYYNTLPYNFYRAIWTL